MDGFNREKFLFGFKIYENVYFLGISIHELCITETKLLSTVHEKTCIFWVEHH